MFTTAPIPHASCSYFVSYRPWSCNRIIGFPEIARRRGGAALPIRFFYIIRQYAPTYMAVSLIHAISQTDTTITIPYSHYPPGREYENRMNHSVFHRHATSSSRSWLEEEIPKKTTRPLLFFLAIRKGPAIILRQSGVDGKMAAHARRPDRRGRPESLDESGEVPGLWNTEGMGVGQYARAGDKRCCFVILLTDSVPAGRLLNAKTM